ncbi:hypothetical protein [Ktedonobacter sp. SOSP1-52]|uniref:hypothetical protein n=1 Tax=Ktedonobacter sp. SOSP1-52 TaxID=2778366 RepID=UPI0019156C63|nr:hypothetical protein [Ktedonobacter sp. SOSP1-52]
MEDKSHANTNRQPTVDLRTRSTIRKLQANPLLGEYRSNLYGNLRPSNGTLHNAYQTMLRAIPVSITHTMCNLPYSTMSRLVMANG